MSYPSTPLRGYWLQKKNDPVNADGNLSKTIEKITLPIYILTNKNQERLIAMDGTAVLGQDSELKDNQTYRLLAYAPPITPDALGDSYFRSKFRLRYPYICGAMANGITSVEMVKAAGRAGFAGFFGSGGLSIEKVAKAIDQLQLESKNIPIGFNLIHSPNDPTLEDKIVRLYLNKGVDLVSASAYMDLTVPLVYYRVKGIHLGRDGKIVCPNRIIAKISRIEVARKFLAPPAEKFLGRLLEKNLITPQEAQLSRKIPMADAITAEADSGGHTDNRPALTLLPTILALRDEITASYGYEHPLPVGLGGGIATPDAVAAAFAMGAAYVLTGSINQACVEAGTSETVRQMLAEAQQADVIMAPAADMFELGVKVQVLKRGTMFAFRAAKLYELYRNYDNYTAIPPNMRSMLERDYFKSSFEEEWQRTRQFFLQRDPQQIERAEATPKHKMALVFRSYLGQSSHWANAGVDSRKMDYQIWCGPAMGAFNQWTKGSFLAEPVNRDIVTVGLNLLYGACVQMRANWLSSQGVSMGADMGRARPLKRKAIEELLADR